MTPRTLCAILMAAFTITLASGTPSQAGWPKCLPGSIKVKLNIVRKKYGRVTVISSYRRNARVRRTGKRSYHASCRAVDFKVPRRNYWKAARWLRKTHKGGVGTYSGRFNHIHIDNGRRARWHN